jgi:hypothetical protein
MSPRSYKLSLIVSGVKATVVSEGHKPSGGQIHHPRPCNHTSVIAGDCDLVGQFEQKTV